MKNLIILVFCFAGHCNAKKEKITQWTYGEYLTRIEGKRVYYANWLSTYPDNKAEILNEASAYLLNTISDTLFPYWYKTPWDFNGTTRIPQKGKIACGYFVTHVLSDVGFIIPRVKWAQSASEVFIKELVAAEEIKRFSNKPIQDVIKYLKSNGNGLYLVGLDMHTGFVVVKDKQLSFVHSNYYKPEIGVMSEEIDSDNPLKNSSYRVFGKLLSKQMVLNWINQKSYL